MTYSVRSPLRIYIYQEDNDESEVHLARKTLTCNLHWHITQYSYILYMYKEIYAAT